MSPRAVVARAASAPAWFVLSLLALLFSSGVQAAPPEPPTIQGRAAVLMDADSGEILYALNPHRQLPPASTTKVLTTLIGLETLSLNGKVMVSARAANTPPSRLGLRPGEALSAMDLLYGMMLKSGNDASEVVAEAVAGSIPAFAEMMNARARLLGAFSSRFRNPHGLPSDRHLSTAYDLAMIFRGAMRNPQFAEIVRTRNAFLRVEGGSDWRTIPVRNSNRLLTSFYGASGGKTGYTRAARRCFVGSGRRGGTHLVVAVLGSPTRSTLWADVRALFEYGFELRTPPTVAAVDDAAVQPL